MDYWIMQLKSFHGLVIVVYFKIIPRARVGYDDTDFLHYQLYF